MLKRIAIGILVLIVVVFTASILVLYWKQDQVIQSTIGKFNEDFKGAIVIGDTDISPFANFPYISIVVSNVQVFEDQADMFAPILDVSNIYLGFNILTILDGDLKVKKLKVENGNFDIVRHYDGTFNLVAALSGEKDIEEIKKEYSLELEQIELANLDIIKYDEATGIHAETYIEEATSRFVNSVSTLQIALESKLVLNVIDNGDSTVFKNKHFDATTELVYDKDSGMLIIHPSDIMLENGSFNVDGSIDIANDFDMNIDIHGNNPNFNLLIAFAPEQLIPTLEQYDNAGKIYFEAEIRGKSLRGQYPAITAEFGCDSAFFANPNSNTVLDQISFNGNFTNGFLRDLPTMEFRLENVSAKPEAGTFQADLSVKNFLSPEIEMSISSQFDLDFLAKFLNVSSLQDLSGDVSLTMNFRDIVDLQNPEKSLEEFSQSYFTELEVENLSFRLPDYHLPFDSIDIKATMDGNQANIEYIYLNMGKSDLTIRGEIDDLPAIVHQTSDTVNAGLFIFSSLLDIKELTSGDTANQKPVDEQIENMRLELGFSTAARNLSNYEYLPHGEFYIRDFYGKMQHYPHTLRKFGAHVIIEEDVLNVLDFHGTLDKSLVNYEGTVYDYAVLMQDTLRGEVEVDFGIKSDIIRLHDLFTYKGENYVPKDYRHEEIHNLAMYGNASFEFQDSLIETDVFFDQLNADLLVHDMQIDDISGKFEFTPEHMQLRNMAGAIGETNFSTNMHLYFGDNDSIRRASSYFELYAPRLDFDQLSNYEISSAENETVSHDSAFNIYKLPFNDLRFAIDVDELTYHKHLIRDLNGDVRIQTNHHLYIDTLTFYTGGGHIDIGGYFDGSNPDSIFFYPKIRADSLFIDQMLYRFDNFGQDYILSNNLDGRLSGSIFGRLRVHADMVPYIEYSEFFMQLEIVDGVLKDYAPVQVMSDYFRDKNLQMIRFDTLSNQLLVSKGTISIPTMTINSSLGYLDISGSQDFNNNMEFYFRVPLKVVTKAARQKLFGKKGTVSDSTQLDEIQYKSDAKKTWYLNLKLEGTPDDYRVSLGKKKRERN